jgi:hypothetical protein
MELYMKLSDGFRLAGKGTPLVLNGRASPGAYN